MSHRPDSLRLMPEYGCDMPLWGDDWRELALPPELRSPGGVAVLFDANYDHRSGWTNEGQREAWSRESDELIADLRRQLPHEISLIVDLWPIEPDRPWWKLWARRPPTTTYG